MQHHDLGMTDQPFRMAPDMGFYVDLAPNRAAVQALSEGLARGDAMVALTGDAGVGKTTVLRRLLKDLDRGTYDVAEMVWPGLDAEDLPFLIAKGFEVPVPEGGDALGALRAYLLGLAAEGRRALLAIDEVQDLPAASLEQLASLAGLRTVGDGDAMPACLQVALVGQYLPEALEDLLAQGHAIPLGTQASLRALWPSETRDYVLQRLARAGWQDRPAFSDGATDRIHALCDGVPRRINLLANRVLHEAALQEAAEVSAEFVDSVEDLRNLELGGLGRPSVIAGAMAGRAGLPATRPVQAPPAPAAGPAVMSPPPPNPLHPAPQATEAAALPAMPTARSATRPLALVLFVLYLGLAAAAVYLWRAGWQEPQARSPVSGAVTAAPPMQAAAPTAPAKVAATPPPAAEASPPVAATVPPAVQAAATEPPAAIHRASVPPVAERVAAPAKAVARPARKGRQPAAEAVPAPTDLARSAVTDLPPPSAPPAPVASCTPSAQSMGLCVAPAVRREPARTAPAERPAEPCEPARAALGLCGAR